LHFAQGSPSLKLVVVKKALLSYSLGVVISPKVFGGAFLYFRACLRAFPNF